MKLVQATEEHLEVVSSLFDQYRQFYLQDKNLMAARRFIKQRLENNDSIIFLAMDDEHKGMGFTQLFPSFSSVGMQRTYILNDLFVAPEYRKQGVAKALMNTAKGFATKNEAMAIKLATAKSNIAAKALYEELGYSLIDSFDYYTIKT